MDFLPIFMNLKGRACLVVGGGEVAARKVDLLRSVGAAVSVVAPGLCERLQDEAGAGRVTHHERVFAGSDLDGKVLVVAATNDPAVNREVSRLAQAHRVPVNVVDQPELCSFIMPSILDRSPVLVAVSTGGASPVLARQLRARLESLIPAAYGRLAELVERHRKTLRGRFASIEQYRRFWERALDGPFAEMVLSGRETEAERWLAREIEYGADPSPAGEVYLVGAGPGDPDLLTFRALRLMQRAEVVLYDRLVSAPILEMTRRDALRIHVGKERARHTVPQPDINRLLVKYAKEGKRVLRLKGGDPFIFGRGGEEIETLAAEGVPFQVVPGITAASGCSAYAGIPLTHRDYAQSCVFVTGHLQDGSMNLNWRLLTQPRQTVVIYMGLAGLDVLCREMIAHGLPASTPAALVERGTMREQRVYAADLAGLPGIVQAANVRAPTLVIVGEVVRLREKLAWFEGRQVGSDSEFSDT
jgi:uroporphyrin-III C-methyltransferase/precorrin-2 dehydrogenase/sirohydrochlorin ferrochelatase